jgi:hypothetical protein
MGAVSVYSTQGLDKYPLFGPSESCQNGREQAAIECTIISDGESPAFGCWLDDFQAEILFV